MKDHHISLEEAAELTRRYREVHGKECTSEYFPKEVILELLSQENCSGLRIYFGLSHEAGDSLCVVLVAAGERDEGDCDLLEIIKEAGEREPPYNFESPLNC